MNHKREQQTQKLSELKSKMNRASKLIAPVWPLENFVAVNPYLGHTHKKFEEVAQELAIAGGIEMALPLEFYLQKIKEGKIQSQDIEAVLLKRNKDLSANDFLKSLKIATPAAREVKTLASFTDVATLTCNKNWNRFVTGRITTWAASYFDKGQASWKTADKSQSPFASWKAEAALDLTTELSGLKGFRKLVKTLPDDHIAATDWALKTLDIPESGTDLYMHRVLLKYGGWSAYASYIDWNNELYGGTDGALIEFLAILICWEACLLESLASEELNKKWNAATKVFSSVTDISEFNDQVETKIILQEAFDRSAQNRLIKKFTSQQSQPQSKVEKKQVKAQAIFCIDVRSEVFRRNLELVDDQIETLGFAGFFGFPINFIPLGYDAGEANCPVLLPTGPTIKEHLPDNRENQTASKNRILNRQVQQVWKSFTSSAVSNFSFVSPLGLSYLPKLFTDSFGLTRPVPDPNSTGLSKKAQREKTVDLSTSNVSSIAFGIPVDQQIQMAKSALTAMSLKKDFAPFVLLAGHGSSMVNNPHATGYDCGACGGHTGEANARVAAAVLNNPQVRVGLLKEGIQIPGQTIFLACLHDTTTDELYILNEQDVPNDDKAQLQSIKESLKVAGKATRTERAFRLHSNGSSITEKQVLKRSKDWSQTRPEWGLAGCSAFVVAPRERTRDLNLEGRSFLHSYNWKDDKEFSVLELIMTAPMVVTSWINLQYYGSVVDNENYGSGNKTLHNVTAGIGVLEGYTGDLRTGLPWQAIHDGENFQHEPLRLNVIIEAPLDAMNKVLEKHPSVRDLCDNGWIHLLAMNNTGEISQRYIGDLNWERIETNAIKNQYIMEEAYA